MFWGRQIPGAKALSHESAFASQLKFNIEYKEVPTNVALHTRETPRVAPRYKIEDLEPSFQPSDAGYFLNMRFAEHLVNNYESKAGIFLHEPQFVARENLSITAQTRPHRAYFGLLHAHTGDSDGEGNVEDAFKMGRDVAHLDFMAVTDHSDFWKYYRKGAWERVHRVALEASTPEFVGIGGFEYSNLLLGHYVVLNTPQYRSAYDDRRLSDFYDWLQRDENKDALVVFAHPGFHRYRKFADVAHFAFVPELKEQLVGIETMHMNLFKPSLKGFSGKKPYYDEALHNGWELGPVASQDNHISNWGIQDSTRLALLLPHLSREEIFKALKARRFYMTSNENLQFSFEARGPEGKLALMGETLRIQEDSSLEFIARFADADGNHPPLRLEVVVNGDVVGRYAHRDENEGTPKHKRFLFWPVYEEFLWRREPVPAIAGEYRFSIRAQDLQKEARNYVYARFYQEHNVVTQSAPVFVTIDTMLP